MDYNDNDYEGHNLHLTGEESSKISSVLRPFSLPKFDFDDSLHGHLRFDSLVENEDFLGIPNQVDNHWIEDYSRGGNGIEFSSSAAVSCALPRHVNVWSEATSSESVEMLLKAVGQEEMVQGENIEESDPGSQLTGPTGQTENNLKQGDIIEDINHQKFSSPPTGVEENISKLNQSVELEVAYAEYTFPVLETNFSSCDVYADNKDISSTITAESLDADMKKASDKPDDTSDLVNDSVPNQVQGNLPILSTETNFTGSFSQNNVVSVKEFVVQDKLSDIGSVNVSSIAEGKSDSVRQQKEVCKENDGRLKGVAIETDNIVSQIPSENPSKMESSKKEHVGEIHVTKFGQVSEEPHTGKSVSTDGFDEVALVDEPAGGSQQGTAVLSSGTGTMHLHEGCSILPERLYEGVGNKGFGIDGGDVGISHIDDKTKLDNPVIESLGQHRSISGNEDSVLPGNNSYVEDPDFTVESSVLHEAQCNPSVPDDVQISNPADDTGKYSGEKSGMDVSIKDLVSSASQKEIAEDANCVSSPLAAGSLQTCKKGIRSMQVDAQQNDLVISDHEHKDKKVPLDSSNIIHGEKEVVGSASSGGDNTDSTSGAKPNVSGGDYPALNSEDKDCNLPSSCIEGVHLVDCHNHNLPSCDKGRGVQGNETESNVLELQSISVSKEVLRSTKIAPAVTIEKGLDVAVAETRMSDPSISLVETSIINVPEDACMESNKTVERSVDRLMVQDGGAEATHIENPIEAEQGKDHETNSSILSAGGCTVEIGRSNQAADPVTSCSDLLQNDANKKACLERIHVITSGGVLTKSEASGATVPSKEEGTEAFTFEIRAQAGLSTGDLSVGLQSFPRIQASKLALVGEGSPSSSGSSQMDAIVVSESSHVTPLSAGVCPPSGSHTERKARRGSSKSGRGGVKKVNKETTPLRHTEKGGKSSQLMSPLGAGQLMAFESVLKPRGAVSIPTCGLPDLNTSSSSSAFFQQPFTDLQQVQLRAQIFVYGSLIQGVAPEEACMVSAFGTSDGGRSIWEPSWRACVERLQSQKSQGNNVTPLPSRPGVKAPDQTNRQSSNESEAITSTSSRTGSKAIPSPVVNPMTPLPSPLWSMGPMGTPCEALPMSSMTNCSSFDYQAVSPLNPCQIPPMRNYIAHSSGPLQTSFPVPWLASSLSSPFEISTSYPALTIMEPVKLTPVKETSFPITSGTKHTSPIPATLTAATTVFAGTPSLDSKKVKASTGQIADTKTRKRKKTSGADVLQSPVTASQVDTQSASLVANQLPKKAPALEDFNQIPLIGHNQANLISKPVIDGHYATSVAAATPSSLVSKSTSNQFLPVASLPMSSITTDHLNRGDLSIDKMSLNVEGFGKVKEVRSQAEEATAHATTAINQCEDMWSQLDQQRNSGLTSENEYKLASAAVAIAAAASVAKAAAAAAKIASSVATEARHMADEVITKSGALNTIDYDAALVSNAMKLANMSPFSILQGGNLNSASSLVISSAREAARKRIEAASAATWHAENLDAIVKAAELAAEAVSHAGKIVTKGDNFSLNELAMAGPDNYWKDLQVAALPSSKPEELNISKFININSEGVSNVYMRQHGKSDVNMHVMSNAVSHIERESSRNLEPDNVTVEENLVPSVKNSEKSSTPQKDRKVSSGSKVPGIGSEPSIVPSIKEGSYVEVLKNRGDLKAWFTATVLSVKDAEALVCYTELKSSEGSEPLKEWISLEVTDGNAPKIRVPHPMTAVPSEGTRKRRRAAVKDYTWSVGDRVDAWLQDCWCEGIVADKNTKDATALSIHVPDIRETLTVKLWHLRPTSVWNDGRWTEWCRPGEDGNGQGDTPDEKRAKMEGANNETRGEAKIAKSLTFGETRKNEKPALPLSASENVFRVGSTRGQSKPKTGRTKKSGTEKEVPRVVIGVPKPGKKRKFMEVSKHYVSEGSSSKVNVPSDSTKLAKVLNPQGPSWGTKNKSKTDVEKRQVAESKTRAPKSGKPPSIPRSVPKKDGSTSSQPNEHESRASDQALMGCTSNDENESGGQNITEFGSFSIVEETSEDTMPTSSQDLPRDNRKKVATRNAKSEQTNLGKPTSTSEDSARDEAIDALNSDVAEPRRSNRRIQPTSRLLEGLQSSMVIPKFPSTSHDKGPRSHKKRPNQKE